MPKSIRTSLWLLVGSFAAGALITILNPAPLPKLPPVTWQMLLMAILSFGLVTFIAVMTYRRRSWARWVHALFFLGGVLLLIPAQTKVPSTSYVISSMTVIVYAAQVFSVALLFVRQSNAWYSGQVQVLPNISLQRR